MVSVCSEISEKYDADRVETANDEDTLSVHFCRSRVENKETKE